MGTPERVVIDTNVFVSALLRFSSTPGQAIGNVLDTAVLLASEATMAKLAEVLSRSVLDRYVSVRDRIQFLQQLNLAAEFVPIVQLARECRDPSDDKFLELAVNGRADVIITGDADLLALNPWREIAIVSPGEYLRRG